jgi:hypothetical protein
MRLLDMDKSIYSIYDKKSELYQSPFAELNNGVATRAIQDVLQQKQHQFYNHSEDYSLYKLGIFDEIQGQVLPHAPELIIEIKTLREQME